MNPPTIPLDRRYYVFRRDKPLGVLEAESMMAAMLLTYTMYGPTQDGYRVFSHAETLEHAAHACNDLQCGIDLAADIGVFCWKDRAKRKADAKQFFDYLKRKGLE